jgi:hypothetical protein
VGRITAVAFDDFLEGKGAIALGISDPSLNNVVGVYDQLAIEAIADQVSAAVGPVSLTIQIAHSANGVHWIPKRPAPEVSSDLSVTGPTYLEIGSDDGTQPSLGMVRLELRLKATAGPVKAHVRVHVTANDVNQKAFAAELDEAERGYPYSSYNVCYPAGSKLAISRIRLLLGYWQYKNQLQLDPSTLAAIVPKNQMVCFNAVGDYILVENGLVIWSSRAYWHAVYEGMSKGPGKSAEDPDIDVTLERSMPSPEALKTLAQLMSQGSGKGDD